MHLDLPFRLRLDKRLSDFIISVLLVAAAVGILSILRGGHPERWCAATIAAGIIIDRVWIAALGARPFTEFDEGRFIIDAVQCCVFVGVAMRANRVYPLFIAASQVVVIVGNIAALALNDGWTQVYWAMTQLPLLLQIAILAAGIAAHVRREARIGRYNCWSPRFYLADFS